MLSILFHIFFKGIIKTWSQIEREIIISNNIQHNNKLVNICMGNDWYNFPSHFFMNKSFRLQFIEQDFRGVLPQYFPPVNGTWVTPILPFNNLNKEESSRYIDPTTCDYIVLTQENASDVSHLTEFDLFVSNHTIQVLSNKIIDSSRSPMHTRAYYIPFVSLSKNKFKGYALLKVI